jgi:hypothetical protein
MVIIILLSAIFCPAIAAAQVSPEPPPLVRFTGSFLPFTGEEASGLSTLTVSIKGTKWRMMINRIEKLTGRDPSGTRLLESIFPRHLRFTGPEHLLNVLRDPQNEGTVMTIEGRLYVGEHMFLLTSVTDSSPARK